MAAFVLPPSPLFDNIHTKKCFNEKQQDLGLQTTLSRYEEILPRLPKAQGWMTEHLVHFNGFWLTPNSALKGVMCIQHHFNPRPTDVFLATSPKTGTTWLKALIFATMNRRQYDFSEHPLLTTGPHACFPFLDAYVHQNEDGQTHGFDQLDALPSPRLLSTHIPYTLLPDSMASPSSGCRFVYICRDPKDVLVSKWLFMNKLRPKQLPTLSLAEAFELFCQGKSHYGPYWDHVLGYWRASLENPGKILFLKYEELKKKPSVVVKRLGEFLGHPFSMEEERDGVVEEIVRLCSFENLSNLEVNKTRVQKFNRDMVVENCHFFRKGKVGDWKNYLSDEMIQRLDQITADKLFGSGLVFDC